MESKEIYRETERHFLAPVLPLLDDPSVTEILINGHQTIYFERDGQLNRSELAFPSAADRPWLSHGPPRPCQRADCARWQRGRRPPSVPDLSCS